MRSPGKTVLAVVAMAVLTAACGGGTGGSEVAPDSVTLESSAAAPREDGPSALDDPKAKGLPPPLIDVEKLVSGGPPPDGIPSIDKPRFQRAGQAGWLSDEEPVLALTVGGQRRAYPVQILIWHEIVNDTVDGVPVAVTYCPLCNSALAFDRRAAGRVVDFGVSGLLYNSDLVMFDRQTKSLWPQLEGRAVAGKLTGTTLSRFPVATVPWKQWRTANPDGWVLSRDTGHERDYGSNPYPGYDQPKEDPFLFQGRTDPRLPPKTRVLGLGGGTDAVAVTLDRLAADGVLEVKVAGKPVVVWARPGLASALDKGEIAEGRQVAATGAFDPVLRERHLHFSPEGDGFTDKETGSHWTLLGEATSGPRKGDRLKQVHHVDTFWFAWVAFLPDTELLR